MNKFLMGATAAALILTGCAQNDLLNGPGLNTPNDGKIRFAASTGLNTKAATDNPFNSTGDLQKKGEFFVQGFVEGTGSDLIGSKMEWNGSSWEYEPTKEAPYWPSTWMDFYAYANWATAPTINADPATGAITATATIDEDKLDATGQKDLLVAITPNATKELRTLLTFKHALTQIVFKAGNVNATKLGVEVSDVQLLNVMSTGNMSFAKSDLKVTWPNGLANIKNYTVQGITKHTVADLTATPTDYSKFPRIQTTPDPANNALMLIPQVFNAWNPASSKNPSTDDTAGGAIQVMASLYDKVKVTPALLTAAQDAAAQANLQKYVYSGTVEFVNAGDPTQGSKITPQALYIPVASELNGAGLWEAGKRINYIISFGDGESGSGGGGYDGNGDPILVPIKFRAVVEEWTEVNVPLLSANIDATSNTITHKFIDGFTNQLLTDITAAAAPKTYNAKLTFNGATSASIGTASDAATANILGNVTFTTLIDSKTGAVQNAKFLPESKLTYDMTGVDVTNGAYTLVAPTDWTLKSTVGKVVTYEKVAKSGYSFVTKLSFIQDNLVALELNENGDAKTCGNTVFVNGVVSNHFMFSSESLAKIVGAPLNSTVTINMSAVTGWTAGTADVTTWCPAGWKATVGAKNYAGGETILLTAAETIVFTKVASTYAVTYQNHAGLIAWLNASPLATAVYYYDNVDFDVEINDATLTSTGTAVAGAKIYLKYPLSTAKVTVTSTVWGADVDGTSGKVVSLTKK